MIRKGFLLALALAATAASAQPYRWVDEKGRVQFTDTPPPPGARNVRKENIPAPAAAPAGEGGVPFAVARAQKDFPVTLYSSPTCTNPCAAARAQLNKRGIPFNEVVVWDEASQEKLKSVAGVSDEVPVLTVGRTVQKGFQAEAYDALLDSAGYPPAGSVPARSQAAPPAPAGYRPPEGATVAKPVEAPPAVKTGPYDPSGLQGPAPKPGQYSLPGDAK